jgi:hypothetical protein
MRHGGYKPVEPHASFESGVVNLSASPEGRRAVCWSFVLVSVLFHDEEDI